jgi:hypothetical protein
MNTCLLFSNMLLLVDATNSTQFSVRSLQLLEFGLQTVQLVAIYKCLTSVKR